MGEWSEWRSFPDPEAEGFLVAPIGPGVYEVRSRETDELVLVGNGKNCAFRITSLLPYPLGQGTRGNVEKRKYVGQHLASLEYRTRAFGTKAEAVDYERWLRHTNTYLFGT